MANWVMTFIDGKPHTYQVSDETAERWERERAEHAHDLGVRWDYGLTGNRHERRAKLKKRQR